MNIVIGRLGRTPSEVADGAEQYHEYWGGGGEWIHARDRARVFETPEEAREHLFLHAEPSPEQRAAHGVFLEMLDKSAP